MIRRSPQNDVLGLRLSLATLEENSLNQPQPLEARMPILAHDQMVMHRNPQRPRHADDLLRHLNVCLRRCRIAGGMVVHQTIDVSIELKIKEVSYSARQLGAVIGGGRP